MRLENEWSGDKKFAQRRTPPNRISRDRVQCVDSHNSIGETIGLLFSTVKKKKENNMFPRDIVLRSTNFFIYFFY